MATEAQINANRQNAKSSSGPRTAEGKTRSSRNAQGLGLFSTQNCVQPEEKEEYDALCLALWDDLSPLGPAEEMFAIEILRGAWRLRRCAAVEGTLPGWVDREARKTHAKIYGEDHPFESANDPSFYTFSCDKQIRVDSARGRATSTVRHATSELRRLQTERLLRSAVAPTAVRLGLASLKEVLPMLDAEEKKSSCRLTPRPPPIMQIEPNRPPRTRPARKPKLQIGPNPARAAKISNMNAVAAQPPRWCRR